VEEAASLLQKLVKVNYHLGIVATLITLYQKSGDTSAAIQLIKSAISHHTQNKSSSDLSALYRISADLHLKEGKYELASQCLEELHHLQPSDPRIIAQLVTAYAQFDSSKAQELSDALPPISTSAGHIDVDMLENAMWGVTSKKVKKEKLESASPRSPQSPKSDEGTGLIVKKKKQKKKKTKLPRGYVVGSIPDPERWLAKRDRSGVKRKEKRERLEKTVSKGTQGAATAKEYEKYDMSKQTASPKATDPSPRVAEGKDSSGRPKHKGNKGRKKR